MLLVRLKVEGHSMEPVIRNGQSVLASSVPLLFSKLKAGDIILFEENKKLIVKRIKDIKGDKIKVSGDNKSDSLDFGLIDRKNIKGKIIAVI